MAKSTKVQKKRRRKRITAAMEQAAMLKAQERGQTLGEQFPQPKK